MKVQSRHIAEIDVRCPTGVGVSVSESGKFTLRAESGQSVEAAVAMLTATAAVIREAALLPKAQAA